MDSQVKNDRYGILAEAMLPNPVWLRGGWQQLEGLVVVVVTDP